MKPLRRRAIAKAAGLRYITHRAGGYDLIGPYGSCGLTFSRETNEVFLDMVRLCSKNASNK